MLFMSNSGRGGTPSPGGVGPFGQGKVLWEELLKCRERRGPSFVERVVRHFEVWTSGRSKGGRAACVRLLFGYKGEKLGGRVIGVLAVMCRLDAYKSRTIREHWRTPKRPSFFQNKDAALVT